MVIPVLNTAKAAWDLLDKRGDIYSSRPRNIMGYAVRYVFYQRCSKLTIQCRQEILSRHNWGLGMPYGERWRRWRKVSATTRK